jgi:hypothetical protein
MIMKFVSAINELRVQWGVYNCKDRLQNVYTISVHRSNLVCLPYLWNIEGMDSFGSLTYNKIVLIILILSCVRRLYKTGYWIDNWIYWITINYTTRLQCITLYNSQQLSLFFSSQDPGSNCCNQLLWHPLPLLVITDSELSHHGCRRPSYIAREQTTKKTPPPIPLLMYDVITGTDTKENNSSFHCCVA